MGRRRSNQTRVGFALQLGTVRFVGTFLENPTNVPASVVTFVARQLDIVDLDCLKHDGGGETHWDHMRAIRQHYGSHAFTDPSEYFRVLRWLYARAWVSDERPSLFFDVAPARLIARVRDRTARRLWRLLARLPDTQQRTRLESLLTIPEDGRYSPCDRLRHGPTRVSAPALVRALRRLEELRALEGGNLSLARVPPSRFKTLGRSAATAWAPTLARLPEDRRIATLLAFARTMETVALDDTLAVWDVLITGLLGEAKKLGQHERRRTARDLDEAAWRLEAACAVRMDERCADAAGRQTVFTQIPRERIADAMARVKALARPADNHDDAELVEQ